MAGKIGMRSRTIQNLPMNRYRRPSPSPKLCQSLRLRSGVASGQTRRQRKSWCRCGYPVRWSRSTRPAAPAGFTKNHQDQVSRGNHLSGTRAGPEASHLTRLPKECW